MNEYKRRDASNDNNNQRRRDADLCTYYMRQEFALCRYGTVLRIMNVKPSVHRTMMGTNVEALLVDVVGAFALAST